LAQLNYYNHSGMIGWICHEGAENSRSLDNVAWPKQVRTFFQLFQRDKVSAIKKQWEEGGLPLQHASCWLGLGPREVVRLVELGTLQSLERFAAKYTTSKN
jgi:hypothetical protein